MLTVNDIRDKAFKTGFRGYEKEEVNEFLEVLTRDYETLVGLNRKQEQRIKELEERLTYLDDMKESLSKSVVLAQETSEQIKHSAEAEAENLKIKAEQDYQHLIDEAKNKANQILRDAADDAKRLAVETEDLKRQSRAFHQRLLASVETQLGLLNAPEWNELLQPTAVYLQNSDAAFKEVVETVLDEHLPETTDIDATRQFSAEEMAELQRRIDAANAELEAQEEDGRRNGEQFSGETQTFKLNI